MRQHHSFVQLPDDGFQPRTFDPRVGLFAVSFFDYGKAFDEAKATFRFEERARARLQTAAAAGVAPGEPSG